MNKEIKLLDVDINNYALGMETELANFQKKNIGGEESVQGMKKILDIDDGDKERTKQREEYLKKMGELTEMKKIYFARCKSFLEIYKKMTNEQKAKACGEEFNLT